MLHENARHDGGRIRRGSLLGEGVETGVDGLAHDVGHGNAVRAQAAYLAETAFVQTAFTKVDGMA